MKVLKKKMCWSAKRWRIVNDFSPHDLSTNTLNSIKSLQNGIGLAMAFIIAGISAAVAFGLTVVEFLRLVRASEEITGNVEEPHK